MAEGPPTNGTVTPLSSKLTGLALTEYTAAPTPPSEQSEHKVPGLPPNWNIPEESLLPNGYPDVRCHFSVLDEPRADVLDSICD